MLMKKRLWFVPTLLMASVFALMCVSCGGDDDDEVNPTPEKPSEKPTWTIACSDEVIGYNQTVVLTTTYTSDNPNLLITWYDNDSRLNAIARSEADYNWTAGKVGTHRIKAVITDREDIVEVEKEFEVVATDLANVILGDKKSKVLLTLSSYKDKRSYIEYGTSSDLNKCYFNSGSDDAIVEKISNEKTYQWVTYENTTGYYLALGSFQEAVKKAQSKYGDPISSELPAATELDEYVVEGVAFYNGQKSYKAVFKLRENHTVTLTLRGTVKGANYWGVNGDVVVMPESYTVVTVVE